MKFHNNIEQLTPLYAILSSKENLRFDKIRKGRYFYVSLIFYSWLYKENRKHFFHVANELSKVEVHEDVWEISKLQWEH